MNILAFDTSSVICSVAIQCHDQIISLSQPAKMQHGQLILSMINEVLNSCSLTVKQLDAIAVGCGPGSFTGVRIACSVAQGLAFGLSLPVITISSLAALAETVYLTHHSSSLLLALDARTEQIYWACYRLQNGHMALVGEEQLSSPDAIISPPHFLSRDHSLYGIGDGWEKYQSRLMTALGFSPNTMKGPFTPDARAILSLATHKITQQEWIAAKDVLPVYLS